MTIHELFAELEYDQPPIPIDRLTARMEQLELTVDDVRPWVSFDDQHYQRNLWQIGPAYAALIMCWRPGQSSPIHDHAGSACGVRVLQGIASEQRYDRNDDGTVYPTTFHEYPAGSVCGSFDADIHRMYNAQPASDLVTLHIYTPPLIDIHAYHEEDGHVEIWTDQASVQIRAALGAGI